MDIHDDVTVTLPHWKWMYLLGWIAGQKPPAGNNVLDSVVTEIASGVQP